MKSIAVNFRLIFHLCGWVGILMSVSMLMPIAVSFYFDDSAWKYFLYSSLLAGIMGAAMILQDRHAFSQNEVRNRDGLAAVGIAWLLIGIWGAFPYWLSGTMPGWDGLFESFSGFSTTGATAAADVEALPGSILFWRALSHWLGGMGIVVLMLAILPFFGFSGVNLFKNESTMAGDKLKPRVAETAKVLWFIYVLLTGILIALLLAGGMNWFDAVCHAFSTIATGGFSNKNLSIGHYESSYITIVLTIFMFMGSLNFALYYRVARGDWRSLFHNTESRVFLFIVLTASLFLTFSLIKYEHYTDIGESLRESLFQVVSVISTTGFSTSGWEQWPHFSQCILLALFFVGGCAGSTSGGLKCVRWILLFKSIHRSLRQQIHPRAILPVRLGGKAVPEETMTAVWSFCALYFITIGFSTLILASMNIDILTAFSAASCAVGNVGIGLGTVGPSGNFSHLPGAAKAVLSMCMFLGRLEFLSLLILFLPEFWRK